jgi:hypothetical protein
MSTNGQPSALWGFAVEGKPATMLLAALRALGRNGSAPRALAACDTEPCDWARQIAKCLASGECRSAILFCQDAGPACCVANKVPGVRAAAVWTVAQACRALQELGANLLVVEMNGRTYFEFRELLRLCRDGASAACPPAVARVLQELDGHAHR